jgi:hypothetical protein
LLLFTMHCAVPWLLLLLLLLQATSGRLQPTPEVVAAVDKDMAKISRKKPQLPWTASSAAGGGSKTGSKAGSRQQQQQLPRSARKKR